ncbi:MAG: phosphatase PAP2 family protein [Deltaproteobacteria bacterium]|nr:MAG: phosphatase PAP2 family protein [Deltaproteobacteria bacterium]
MNLNGTDRMTIIYNLVVVFFVLVFWKKISLQAYHITFNLSVIFIILLLSLNRRNHATFFIMSLWYPLVLYAFLHYQSGMLNTVVIPRFLDDFFLNLDVKIFGKFPAFYLRGENGNLFLDEFFHFAYANYYIVIPMTAFLLYPKDKKLFERFVYEISILFYVCFLIYIFLPVEGPLKLRHDYFQGGGLFKAIVDYFYAKGDNAGGAFPSSHVAVTFLVAWWAHNHLGRLKIYYWSVLFFLSIATVYCMFHYAVDIIAGWLVAVLFIYLFNRTAKKALSA